MKAVLVDDNEIDLLNLRTLLEDYEDIEVAGEAKSVAAAVRLIDAERPEAVFLDLHLGRQMGFAVLEGIQHHPQVVITTSHPHYALQGFEVEAVDYLLKPILEETLLRAVTRLRERCADGGEARGAGRLALEDLVSARLGVEALRLPVQDIQAVVGERVYTRMLMRDGRSLLHSRPLREWRALLPEEAFFSLDRSTIVQLGQIRSVREGPGGRWTVLFLETEHSLQLGGVGIRTLRGLIR